MNTNHLKDFVPYKQALALKKLGFDEPCLAKYYIDIAGETLPHFRYNNRINKAESIDEGVWFNHNLDKDHIWSAPTFFQAFRWFREKHNIDAWVQPFVSEKQNGKPFLPDESYAYYIFEDGVYLTDGVNFLDSEEAELECLKKLIEIVMENNKDASVPNKIFAEPKKEYDLFGNEIIKDVLLRDKFFEPPFSVLDTKGGNWQNRKRQWKNIGIESHLGREGVVVLRSFDAEKYGRKEMPEVSIFDPALCELIYRWYCPDGGTILDPFSGGSVRGIVANYLGYKYTGIDIRQEQIDSNLAQCSKILSENNQPKYYVGDSNEVLTSLDTKYDFVFSCPPYADLEIYSDNPKDLSTMEYEVFIKSYREIIRKSILLLKKDCYAVFVVGDIRDKKGYYRDFISHTKQAFIDAGAKLYNEAILLQPLGTAMLRAGKIFESGKKLTKVHENVLIFKKP